MIPELPKLPCPDWLSEIAAKPERAKTAALPLPSILADSLYYPGSGFDGDPVRYLAGNVLSFVYADRNRSKEKFISHIDPDRKGRAFLGYRPIPHLQRFLNRDEIAPPNWSPPYPVLDHDWEKQAYAHWSVWKRTPEHGESHGPLHFSFLFLGWEARAAFEALYILNKKKPKIITIISPGNAPLGVRSEFKRRVMENPVGTPDYLLCNGGRQPRTRWPQYGTFIAAVPDGSAKLWALGGGSPEIDDEIPGLPE